MWKAARDSKDKEKNNDTEDNIKHDVDGDSGGRNSSGVHGSDKFKGGDKGSNSGGSSNATNSEKAMATKRQSTGEHGKEPIKKLL